MPFCAVCGSIDSVVYGRALSYLPVGNRKITLNLAPKSCAPRVGIVSPVAEADFELDRLTAKFDELSNLEIDRHRPLTVEPVEGGFAEPRQSRRQDQQRLSAGSVARPLINQTFG